MDALLLDKSHTAALEQLENFSDKPPAIILDVDQTVLDNSAYQARIIEKGISYPNGWFDWAKEEQAEFKKADEEIAHLKTLLKPKKKKLPKGYVE